MKNKLFLIFVVIIFFGCSPTEKPEVNDLKGKYYLNVDTQNFLKTERHYSAIPLSSIELEENGNLIITNLPDCYTDLTGNGNGGFVSGQGKWKIEKYYSEYGLSFEIAKGYSLESGSYATIVLKNRSAPFALQLFIGDPDSHEYLLFEKQL